MLVGQLWLFMPMLFNFPALGSTSAIAWRHWQWRRIMIERFLHSKGACPVVKINHGILFYLNSCSQSYSFFADHVTKMRSPRMVSTGNVFDSAVAT
jgi:hypothetical protein